MITTQVALLLQGGPISGHNLSTDISLLGNFVGPVVRSNNAFLNTSDGVCDQIYGGRINSNVQRLDSSAIGTDESVDLLVNDGLKNQDSFGRWMNGIMTETSGSMGDPVLESSIPSSQDSFTSPEQIFNLTEVSPAWAYSTETTKVFFFFS